MGSSLTRISIQFSECVPVVLHIGNIYLCRDALGIQEKSLSFCCSAIYWFHIHYMPFSLGKCQSELWKINYFAILNVFKRVHGLNKIVNSATTALITLWTMVMEYTIANIQQNTSIKNEEFEIKAAPEVPKDYQ